MNATTNRELQVLIIEDKPEDATLIERELRKGGLQFEAKHATALEDFLHMVRWSPPDVILSDHGLPSFDGFAALALVRQSKRCPDIPFIFVTGTMTEDAAIKTFERGATDYVLKGRLKELVPVVRRAIALAEERRRHHLLDRERMKQIQELRKVLAQRRAALAGQRLVRMCASCRQVRDSDDKWKSLEAYAEARLGVQFSHGMCPECATE